MNPACPYTVFHKTEDCFSSLNGWKLGAFKSVTAGSKKPCKDALEPCKAF
jgi:hypothetical protein